MIIKENTFKEIAVTKGKINSTEDHLALKYHFLCVITQNKI